MSLRTAARLAAASLAALAGACAPGTPTPGQPLDAGPTIDAAPASDGGVIGYPWKLIWQDEFDGAAGARPEASRWAYDIGGDGWGNEQLEFDTDRTDNVALDGEGHLAIIARREDFNGRAYTSARLKSAGRFERMYGRFEARIKLPFGQGIWPAFWMLGANYSTAGWPGCGEIDVMEHRGQQTRMIRGSLHGPGYSGGGNHGREFDAGENLSADFHTYVVEWDPGRVIWKVDNKVYFTATPEDLPEQGTWVYDHTFFILLNLAVGGNFSGNPDGTTIFPQTMLVDYVRVYERLP